MKQLCGQKHHVLPMVLFSTKQWGNPAVQDPHDEVLVLKVLSLFMCSCNWCNRRACRILGLFVKATDDDQASWFGHPFGLDIKRTSVPASSGKGPSNVYSQLKHMLQTCSTNPILQACFTHLHCKPLKERPFEGVPEEHLRCRPRARLSQEAQHTHGMALFLGLRIHVPHCATGSLIRTDVYHTAACGFRAHAQATFHCRHRLCLVNMRQHSAVGCMRDLAWPRVGRLSPVFAGESFPNICKPPLKQLPNPPHPEPK